NDPRYADTERLVRVAASMLERLSTSPGIDAAALVNYPPLSVIRVGVPITIEGQAPPPGQLWIARYWVIAPGYFRTAGIPLFVGRDFTSTDDRTRGGVAIVSETFARRFWNTTDVVGKRLRPFRRDSYAGDSGRCARRRSGVSGELRENLRRRNPGDLRASTRTSVARRRLRRARARPFGRRGVRRDGVSNNHTDARDRNSHR